MKWLIGLLFILSHGLVAQSSKCKSGERQWPELLPIITKTICWEDIEIPNQHELLQQLLPKVKGGKIPGLYVSIDVLDSGSTWPNTETYFSPATYDTTQEGVYVHPGVRHVLDYNNDHLPDIVAENRFPQRTGIIQFWKNKGDSLELEFEVGGYIAWMERDQSGRPLYFLTHRLYCCESSIVHLMRYDNVLKAGNYTFELTEKWIYHMNSDMTMPSKFDVNVPALLKGDAELNIRKRRLQGSVYMENLNREHDAASGLYKERIFVPAAKISKGSRATILNSEVVDGKEWCYIILDKNTSLKESTFEKHTLTRSPQSDVPKIRYLGYVEKSFLKVLNE